MTCRQHTPGPWAVEPIASGAFNIRGNLARGPWPECPFLGTTIVAEVPFLEGGVVFPASLIEAEANARLIAAAPALYLTLCRATRVLVNQRDLWGATTPPGRELDAVIAGCMDTLWQAVGDAEPATPETEVEGE